MIKITEPHINIMVNDLDKSINFYQSIGLTLKNRWDNHYAMVNAAELVIGLHPSGEKNVVSTSVSIGFNVDNVHEAQTLLEKNNIPFKKEEGKSGIYLHFNDLDGTTLYYVLPKWK